MTVTWTKKTRGNRDYYEAEIEGEKVVVKRRMNGVVSVWGAHFPNGKRSSNSTAEDAMAYGERYFRDNRAPA